MIWNYDPGTGLEGQLSSVLLFPFNRGSFVKHFIDVQCRERLYFRGDSCLLVHLLGNSYVLLVVLEECLQVQLGLIGSPCILKPSRIIFEANYRTGLGWNAL
jgi:hypothetical protein